MSGVSGRLLRWRRFKIDYNYTIDTMHEFVTRSTLLVLFLAIVFYFARFYFAGCVCKSEARMEGKTAIVTGANTGIGKETALDLARRGARVIMACRNLNKADAALKEIVAESGNKNVVLKHLDLASLKSVRAFAQDINTNEPQLDVLINNAGVAYHPELRKTEDGFEMTMGVNHLGHFLLTNLLVDLLKKSVPSRIVVVSSTAHWVLTNEFHFENMNSELFYHNRDSYGQSKLANILFVKELAKRLEGSGVTANSLHPGVIPAAEFLRHTHYIVQVAAFYVGGPFSKTPKQGAQTTIHVAVSEEVAGVSGMFFSDCEITEPAKTAQDGDVARKLWDVSRNLVGLNTTV